MRKVPELRFDGFEGEWEEHNLNEFISIYGGLTYSPKDVTNKLSDTFVIRSSNVKNNSIIDADNVYVNSSIVNTENVKIGDIILVVRNGSRSLIGKHAVITKDMPNTVIGAFMSGVRARTPDFINALFDTSKFDKNIQKNLGATINQITNKNISEMKFFFTNTAEQEKIGNLFKKIDALIQKQEAKVSKMREYKKSMVQKMFPKKRELVPAFRFDGFDGEWKTVKFKEFLKEYNEKTKNEDELVMLSSTNSGMTYRERNVSVTTNVGYKIIYKNDLVLSPQNLWLGNINFNNLEDGIVSPSYLTFKIDGLDSNFIEPQLRTKRMLENYKNASSQGASIVRRNLEKNEFHGIKLLIPSLEEQQKIGQFFKNLDSQIENEKRLLDSYKMMKKSLLQKMFV